MCVFFTLRKPFSFYPCASSITPHPVSVLILHPIHREIQALWSQNYDTEITHGNAVKGVDNAMPCHRTYSGYDRHNIRKTKKGETNKKGKKKKKRNVKGTNTSKKVTSSKGRP